MVELAPIRAFVRSEHMTDPYQPEPDSPEPPTQPPVEPPEDPIKEPQRQPPMTAMASNLCAPARRVGMIH